MRRMSDVEWRAFALTGTRTAKLAVVRRNGLPHVTPVWFLLDQSRGTDEIVFTTWHESVKGRLLRARPLFSVCVDDERPPYSYAMLECRVREIVRDSQEVLTWATRLGQRYMGAELAADYGRRNSVPGELLVRATITNVIALAGIAD